jgi:hypothetical protein
MELDGSSFDKVSGGVYTFEDIDLAQGETLTLPLTVDVKEDTSYNGKSFTVVAKVTEVEDDENDITYSTTAQLNTVLSSNAFDNSTIDIKSASFTLNETRVNDREIVLGNGIETVVYKAKVSVGDSDDVVLKDFDLTMSGGSTLTEELDDVIDSATLNIGGKTFDGDVDADSIDFSSIDAAIAAGSDNVEVLVTVVLKDNDSVTNGQTLIMELLAANVELEDSEGEDLAAANITLTTGTKDTTTTLRDRGTLEMAVINNGDLKDSIEDTVLAGSTSVNLAEIEYKAEYEDVKVKELVFKVTGDMSDTIKEARIVAGSTTIVDGAVVTFDGTDTLITFKNDFVLTDSDSTVSALLVADLNPITDQGDETSAVAGDIVVKALVATDIDSKGVNSNDDLTATLPSNVDATAVTVVPAIVTVAVTDKLGSNDKYGKLTFTIDKGNNQFDNDDILITKINLESATTGVTVRNDDNTTVVDNNTTATLILSGTDSDKEINTGDVYEFKAEADNAEVRINKYGIEYTLDVNGNGTIEAATETFKTNNDKIIDLGEYDND